jgi:transcriptional regulator with AAA-type ATPase domain
VTLVTSLTAEFKKLERSRPPASLLFCREIPVLPVGATHPIRVDVRVLAATNRDLDELVSG